MADDHKTAVGGVLGEMIDAGESRHGGAVPFEDEVRPRPTIRQGVCSRCGNDKVVARPLLSGRVYRCGKCNNRWTGPAASRVPTVLPTIPPPRVVDPGHPVMAPKAYRLGGSGDSDE